MERRSISFHQSPTGVVVRPCRVGRAETFVFFPDRVHPVIEATDSGAASLGPALALTYGTTGGTAVCFEDAQNPIYEPFTDCIYFTEKGKCILRLDADNMVSWVAGSVRGKGGDTDGSGLASLFQGITALAADGRGAIYVADGKVIRKLVVSRGAEPDSCVVTKLPVTIPTFWPTSSYGISWKHLSYDPEDDALLATVAFSLCRVRLGWPTGGSTVQLVAGSTNQQGHEDGQGAEARMLDIRGIAAAPGGSVYIADGRHLRKMDSAGHVSTLAVQMLPGRGYSNSMTLLPDGCLAVTVGETLYLISGGDEGGGFRPSCEVLAGWRSREGTSIGQAADGAQTSAPQSVAGHPADPSAEGTSSSTANTGSSSNSNNMFSGMVCIRMGDRTFHAHPALLSDRCEYFKRQMEGGFGDCNAAEITLEDADPDAFYWLLCYMYGWSKLADVPSPLLRPTAELAGRLLLPDACGQLKQRLLAGCTPGSVVADLLWADKHNLSDLLPDLKAYFVRHVKQVTQAAPKQLEEMAACSPGLAAQLFRALGER